MRDRNRLQPACDCLSCGSGPTAPPRALEVQYTPTFVINGRRVVGVHPIEDLRAMIDTALAERL